MMINMVVLQHNIGAFASVYKLILREMPDEADKRPADRLIIPSALSRQSSWYFLPRIIIDFPHFGLQEGTWLLKTI